MGRDPASANAAAIVARRDLVRAIAIAVVVGTTLVLINHGDHLADEPVCRHFFLKVVLSYLTPFIVSLVTAQLVRRNDRHSW